MTGYTHQRVEAWDAYPRERCVHELFEAQVERTPDAVAVVCGDESLSYGELNARANQLAHHLRARGVGPGQYVAVCLERSIELLVGVLSVLKAGGAYAGRRAAGGVLHDRGRRRRAPR